MDPLKFLREKDHFVRSVMQAVAAAAHSLENERDEQRARLIAAEVSKIFKKG